MNAFLNAFYRYEQQVKWFVAEFFGTAILALTVGVLVVGVNYYNSTYQALFLPFMVGALITVLVYVFGPISGAHFNPAVSLGLWIIKKIRGYQMVIHMAAQILGAYIGAALVRNMIGLRPDIIFTKDTVALGAEAVGAAILMAAVVSVVAGKTPQPIAGVSIGLALVVGISISMVPSGGILNPAIALAFGGFHIIYIVGPLLGAVISAIVMNWLHMPSRASAYQPGVSSAQIPTV